MTGLSQRVWYAMFDVWISSRENAITR